MGGQALHSHHFHLGGKAKKCGYRLQQIGADWRINDVFSAKSVKKSK
jgi:hypothetical protein